MAVAAAVIVALLQVVQTSEATTASFAIQRLEQDKMRMTAGLRQLEAEIASLSSLSRIEHEAGRLGLEPAQARASVQVNAVWTSAEEGRLPSRFVPRERDEAEADGQGSPWWQDLLGLLPFN